MKIDIVHCHDWHVALIPFLVKKQGLPVKTLLTIHNIGYQGIYPQQVVNQILNTNFTQDINCLREGVLNADLINTVSENYAKEILTPEFGFGLENGLKKRKKNLVGILNGLDLEQFSPENDPYLKKNYSIKRLEDKIENKIYLQKICFKTINPETPVLGMVSRLARQKGLDLIGEIFPQLMKENVQFIMLGKGGMETENFFQSKAREYPRKFFIKIAFDEELAHRIYAGSDIFLMPSYFEPCGLGQMIAMRYGTVPVARTVGGLKDTIKNVKYQMPNAKCEGTGFLFKRYGAKEFLKTVKTALRFYKNKKIWRQIQKNGMKQDFSWKKSAKEYLRIYRLLAG